MGRGRAKAKQTKVARDLKYRPMDTDFGSLERELRGSSYTPSESERIPEGYEDLAAEYSSSNGSAPREDDDPDQ